MNLKKIRTCFKNAIIVAFSMLVLAGATGLSYKAHYCHDKLSGIAFYPELGIQQSASCGCADIQSGASQQPSGDRPVLSKNSCCSNVSYFSKLTIESPVKDFISLVLLQPAIIEVFGNTINAGTYEKVNISSPEAGLPPSPLAGRKLVLFLSQQRIPLISFNG
jgi:hypothetical protein